MSAKTRALATQLVAELSAELEASDVLLERIAAQRSAVLDGDPAAVELASVAVGVELDAAQRRAPKVPRVLADLAVELGVPASTLSVGVAAERLELAGEPLGRRIAEKRARLIEARAELERQSRQVATIVLRQRRFVSDLLTAVLAPEEGAPLADAGALIDASA